MNLSAAVTKVIDLGGKVRDYYDAELPKWYPNYPLMSSPDEEGPPPPPEEKELEDFLNSLPENLIYQLLLLMDLAWGDVSMDNLADRYGTLKKDFRGPEDAVSRMMYKKAVLVDELSDGLEELRKHKIHVDKMPLKKVKVGKR